MSKTILVLEDEQALSEVISKKLELSGFKVLTARKVNQALDYLQEGAKVDCVWLDHYLLGKENGLDFVATLKNNGKWQKIPIFVVSNTASGDKVQAYLHLGVEKYFTKANYKLEEIIEQVKKTLEESENEKDLNS